MDDQSQSEYIQRALRIETTDEQRALYNDWAASYNQELEELAYVAPRMGAEMLARYVDNSTVPLLDVGCGTGLVGVELGRLGFGQIDGIDLSAGMLEMAGETGRYATLDIADISLPLPFADSSYAALISIGTLGNHLKPNILDELIRVLQPDGALCFSVRKNYYHGLGYKDKVVQLVSEHKIELLASEELDYIQGENVTALFIAVRKLSA